MGVRRSFYDEVFDNVYWNKIRRGDEFYLTAKLEAVEPILIFF